MDPARFAGLSPRMVGINAASAAVLLLLFQSQAGTEAVNGREGPHGLHIGRHASLCVEKLASAHAARL